jgi:hypothetical protein
MRQVIGAFVELLAPTVAINGIPTGSDGIRLSDVFKEAQPMSTDWLLRLVLANAVSSGDFYLWGKDKDITAPVWGTIGEGDGQLDGTTIAGTISTVKYYPLSNLGVYDRLYLQLLNPAGAGFGCQADIAPFYNGESNGLA